MRAVFPVLGALVVLPLAASLGACGDPFGANASLIRTDTLALATVGGPSTQLATAIDIVSQDAPSIPELPTEAGAWDVQVRQAGTSFSLVPNPGIGQFRGAGLVKTTRTIEDPGNAPTHSADYTRTPLAAAAGDAFYVQSRQSTSTCGTLVKYALLKVISTVPDSGLVHLAVRSNQSCGDERLGG